MVAFVFLAALMHEGLGVCQTESYVLTVGAEADPCFTRRLAAAAGHVVADVVERARSMGCFDWKGTSLSGLRLCGSDVCGFPNALKHTKSRAEEAQRAPQAVVGRGTSTLDASERSPSPAAPTTLSNTRLPNDQFGNPLITGEADILKHDGAYYVSAKHALLPSPCMQLRAHAAGQ